MSTLPVIGFIGTGVMGRSMAEHLATAGYALEVHNRTKSKANSLLDAGAHWHDSAAGVACAADVVITMLGFPSDVEATYLGEHGVIAHARDGALLIDMTTSSPVLARRIAAAGAERGLHALDAPVSGGDIGARAATLVIMTGGEQAAFDRAQPLLALLGKNISLLGPAGAGQHCKMANQIAVAVGMVAWCEALIYARAAGLDPQAVHASISGGIDTLAATAEALGYDDNAIQNASVEELKALKSVGEWQAKAAKYDKAMAKQMERVRDGKKLPPVSKPGAAKAPGAGQNTRYQADREAMRRGDKDAELRILSAHINS